MLATRNSCRFVIVNIAKSMANGELPSEVMPKHFVKLFTGILIQFAGWSISDIYLCILTIEREFKNIKYCGLE
jgi:hypothetical protein